MSGVAAFGAPAQRYADALPPGLEAIIAHGLDSASALAAAVDRRLSGKPFFAAPMLDEPRALLAVSLAPALLAQSAGPDALRQSFDALAQEGLTVNGLPQRDVRMMDVRVRETLGDLVAASDAVLARSQTELDRIYRELGRRRPYFAIKPGADPDVPAHVPHKEANQIVVWAPLVPASHAAIILYALKDLRVPITLITGAFVQLPHVHAAQVGLPDAAEALAHAEVVIDADFNSPTASLALASLEIPLVAAVTSGAHEFLAGIQVYEPWSWRSVLAAVSAARGAGPGTLRTSTTMDIRIELARAAALPDPPEPPLVSIIMPSYNRRALLPTALETLQRQTDKNLEVVVVNDGGEPLEDIIAQFPHARLINKPTNEGATRGANTGIRSASGKYIGLLADDDFYYPDHISRLVDALERSGAKIAHGNVMTRFDTRLGGLTRTTGHKVLFSTHMDPLEVLWASPINTQSLLVHRDVFERHGYYDATAVHPDYEWTVRMAQHYDFIHVNHVTAQWNYCQDRSVSSHPASLEEIVGSYSSIFAQYPSESQIVASGRKSTLDWFTARHGTPYFEPALPYGEQTVQSSIPRPEKPN